MTLGWLRSLRMRYTAEEVIRRPMTAEEAARFDEAFRQMDIVFKNMDAAFKAMRAKR
jgi:hypothetical protein